MRLYDLIIKKRNGEALLKEEWQFLINGYVAETIPDYQVSALLMTVYFKGLTLQEMTDLTDAMMHSGETIDLSGIEGVIVDKHSTGGVGDKTSLILGPMVAAAGVKMAKLSGRGLGHTGGTIDKLESFTGFTTELIEQEFIDQVNSIGLAIIGQTKNLVPADKKLYALRDVTGTVDSNGLIASSIMSKKLVSGADVIVLDVKMGSGAFMKTYEQAADLAEKMVKIGERMDKKVMALITEMEQPLGRAVGNALEVKEAIDTLKGKGPEDITKLCMELGAHILYLSELVGTVEEGYTKLQSVIDSGEAFDKFRQFVAMQKGNVSQVDDTSLLPKSDFTLEVESSETGYVSKLDALKVGLISLALGAGRVTKEDDIDLSAGVYLCKKVGEKVKKGECLAILHGNSQEELLRQKEELLKAYQVDLKDVMLPEIVKGIVTRKQLKLS